MSKAAKVHPVRDLAEVFEVSLPEMFAALRAKGLVKPRSCEPTPEAVQAGVLVPGSGAYRDEDGDIHTRATARITERGFAQLRKFFGSDAYYRGSFPLWRCGGMRAECCAQSDSDFEIDGPVRCEDDAEPEMSVEDAVAFFCG